MACEIDVKINGKVVFTAKNDRELDEWLAEPSRSALLSDGIEFGFGKIYSLDSKTVTLKKIDKVRSFASDLKIKKLAKAIVSVGVTTFYNYFGRSGSPENAIQTFSGAKPHVVKPTDVGTEVDDVINSFFKGSKVKSRNYVSDEKVEEIKASLRERVLPTLKGTFGIKVSDPQNQYLSQLVMATKSWNEDISNALKNSSKSFTDKDGKIIAAAKDLEAIEGIADLVIIDDDGVAHIIDFKTAEDVGSDGMDFLNKHQSYVAQVATYGAILRQFGIPIGQSFLVVYKTDYTNDENGLHIKLDNVSFDKVIRIPNTQKYMEVVENYFWTNSTVQDSTIQELGNVLNELFPETPIAHRLQARDVQYDFMIKYAIRPVPKGTKEYEDGQRFYFTKRASITGNRRNERVYGKTKGELINDTLDSSGKVIVKAPYKEYIDLVNKKKANRFQNFAKDLQQAMVNRNLDDFEAVVDSIAPRNRDVLMHHFKRYILGNWKFKANEACNVNGIYLFEKGNRLEIVIVDEEQQINKRYDFRYGNSILGSYIRNSTLTDNRIVMDSSYGNMMLMKACALLSLDPDLTKDKRVTNIKALNFHSARVYEENPTRLCNSWNLLAQQYNQTHTKKLRSLSTSGTFKPDAQALMDIADEYIELLYQSDRSSYGNLYRERQKDRELTREYLIQQMHLLQDSNKKLYNLEKGDYNDPEWIAYAYINRALLALEGINIFQEKDLGKVLQGINLTGINMRSFNSSESPVARQMGDLLSRFNTGVRLEFVKEQFTWSKLLDAAYKEEGFSGIIGNDWRFFESWFEKDADGKISSEFRLVRPNKFKQGAAAKKAYLHFLEMNAKYRWPNEDEREEMRDTEEWYEVPMIAGGFLEQFTAGNPLSAIKTVWNKYKDTSLQLVMGRDDVERTRRDLENIDQDYLGNIIDKSGSERNDYIDKFGVEHLEKNLDYVFLNILFSGIRAERSPLFCELFTAMLVTTDYMMDTSGLDIKEIRNAMEKYIASKLFMKDIRNPEEAALNAILGMLKSITANVALGWNTRAFFREILTGQKKHFNRWITQAENRNQFVQGTKKFFERPQFLDYSDFVEAYVDVTTKIFDNTSIFGFYSQLNSIYGMVNFSGREMIESSKRHQWTVLGLSDKSSVTSTAPDFLHRMAILAGHLKTIGAFDAYSLNDEGRLVYDMHKDTRFDTWFKYKDDEDSISDIKTRQKFQQEKQIYEEALTSWNSAGYNLKYGDLLPQALSPMETLSIKEYADEQYGNYDDETKSLIQKQTLGSLFFQYKTYGLAQFALWFSNPGFTNTLTWNYVLNENNERMVQVPSQTEEEYKEHEAFRWLPESQVTEEMWKLPGTKYIKQLGGNYFLGKAQTTWLTVAKVFTLNGDEFQTFWRESPEFRTNVYISMLDLFEFGLIALFLRLFWDTDDTPIYKQGFLPRWTYGVISGMSQDGPLFQTLQGIIGDGTPPVLGMVKNYYRTFTSILNGNTNLLYGLTNTLGMTRELSNLFRGNN